MMARNSIATFPERLRELREAKGWPREQVAVAAGTSYHSVTKLEQGVRAPSLELAWRIAQALGCSLDDLVKPAGRKCAENAGRPAKGKPAPPEEKVKKPRGRPKKEGK